MPDIIRIYMQISWHTPSELEVLRGVRDFMRLRPHWALRVVQSQHILRTGSVDARILTNRVRGLRKRFSKKSGPVVSVVNDPDADVRINVDDVNIGVLAARHLHERGYRHLVFASDANAVTKAGFRRQRYLGFAQGAKEVGADLRIISGFTGEWGREATNARWLREIPLPCGVFCPDDQGALQVIDGCRFAKILVPEEVAVVGADNESLWCETSLPPLSSVAIPWRQVGFEAANWVEKLLAGVAAPRDRLVMLVPDMVVARQSTDCIAISHPLVVQALEFIRGHAFQGIAVKAVEHAVGVNRRQIDRLFLKHLGRTPFDEIRRLQIGKAKELLVWTDLSPREISHAIGMSVSYFSANFQKTVGITALDFRKDHKQRDAMG